MSASTGDKITDVRNAARPTSARVTVARTVAAPTLFCDNLTGWPVASKVHFVTYQIDSNSNPIAGTQLDCSGIVSGTSITSLTVIDGADGGNSIGDVVEMLPTAGWGQDLADALTAGHTRTGGHKAFSETDIVDSAQLKASSVSTVKIADSAVTTAKVADSAITRAKLSGVNSTTAGTGYYFDVGEIRVQAGSIGWASNYGPNGWNTYTVTLPAAFADTNYTPIVNTSHIFTIEYEKNGSNAGVLGTSDGTRSTTQFTVRFYIGNSGFNGGSFNFVAIGKRP